MGDVIYLEDDADQRSDEPKPKADVMTISGADAMALDEFVRHVSIRCYDERFKDIRRKRRRCRIQRNHRNGPEDKALAEANEIETRAKAAYAKSSPQG
ncbi:hypothetical protein [Rhizobium rhizogenes]|uniref:hypothetical protein n=1 Tax=Rhizobium rhizogenes TaxID=359 RepID=UPI00080FA0ED|nr:hypothetical protein [Rhizobium rhizogenes]NTI46653.1 hypothetical protein [Rhizobium rhizogenes]OCJ16474.1 hypothetical protein A6U88_33820 [Agrobacterium sp. B131/95]